MSVRPVAVLPAARLAVRVAVWALPAGGERERYQREFLAELHGLGPSAQARYVAGVLSEIVALRAALGDSSSRPQEIPMTTSARTPFRCRVLRMHRWSNRSAPHHAHVRVCIRCGSQQGPFHTPDEQPPPIYLNPGI